MPLSRTQMAEPRLFSKCEGKKYLRRVFLHLPNNQQNVKEQTIGKAAPSLEEQATNHIACLDLREKTMMQSLIAEKQEYVTG